MYYQVCIVFTEISLLINNYIQKYHSLFSATIKSIFNSHLKIHC